MTFYNPKNIWYIDVSGGNDGEHKNREFELLRLNQGGKTLRVISPALNPGEQELHTQVLRGHLFPLEKPGSVLVLSNHKKPYGLEQHFGKSGKWNWQMLRTEYFAQPRAIQAEDILVSGEGVSEDPRKGHNRTILIHLFRLGWVEVPIVIPVALFGNEHFKFPIDLVEGDALVTGHHVYHGSNSFDTYGIGWTEIYIDDLKGSPPRRKVFRLPSCVPIALQ